MKKLLGIIVLGLLLSGNAYSDDITTIKCKFDKDYEYTINLYEKEVLDLYLFKNNRTEIYLSEGRKRAADITIIKNGSSYNFKGFENNRGMDEHYFIFIDGTNLLFSYMRVLDRDQNAKPKTFEVINFDDAIDDINKGKCEAFY